MALSTDPRLGPALCSAESPLSRVPWWGRVSHVQPLLLLLPAPSSSSFFSSFFPTFPIFPSPLSFPFLPIFVLLLSFLPTFLLFQSSFSSLSFVCHFSPFYSHRPSPSYSFTFCFFSSSSCLFPSCLGTAPFRISSVSDASSYPLFPHGSALWKAWVPGQTHWPWLGGVQEVGCPSWIYPGITRRQWLGCGGGSS